MQWALTCSTQIQPCKASPTTVTTLTTGYALSGVLLQLLLLLLLSCRGNTLTPTESSTRADYELPSIMPSQSDDHTYKSAAVASLAPVPPQSRDTGDYDTIDDHLTPSWSWTILLRGVIKIGLSNLYSLEHSNPMRIVCWRRNCV